jgi:phosphate transport system protein
MGRIAVRWAGGADQAIRHRELTLSRSMDESDDQIDTLRRSLFTAAMGTDWAYVVTPAIDVALLGRFYERSADHADSVAQRMAFVPIGTMLSETRGSNTSAWPEGHRAQPRPIQGRPQHQSR